MRAGSGSRAPRFAAALGVIATGLLLATPPPAEGVRPIAPVLQSAVETEPGSVELRWRDRSRNEANFEIQRAAPRRRFSPIGSPPANTVQHTDSIPATATRVYRIRAENSDGHSAWSNECWVNGVVKPVLAARRTASGVELEWTDSSRKESGFEIQRKSGNERYTTIETVPADTTEYVDGSASPTATYHYRVRALGNAAICVSHSAWSRAVRALTVPLPGCEDPLVDLRRDCRTRVYRYRDSSGEARLTTTGTRITIRGEAFEAFFGADTVEFFAPVTFASQFVCDRACVPDFDRCVHLPIEAHQVCFVGGECHENPFGLRIDVQGSLRDGGETLQLRIVNQATANLSFVGSGPAP
jgi:hypothetical protein